MGAYNGRDALPAAERGQGNGGRNPMATALSRERDDNEPVEKLYRL
jgi:hypothetical protein